MMVNGVALSSMHRRRLGRRRGAERDRHGGVRHRRLGRGRAGGDRRRAHQLHPARRRQHASAARSSAAIAKDSFASDNFTGTDVQQRGLAAPSTIKGNGDFNPGFGGPIKRDKLWFFLSGRYLFADNFVAGMFFNENANKLNDFRYVSTGEQAILHQDQTDLPGPVHVAGQSEEQDRRHLRPGGAAAAVPTGISATVSPEAGTTGASRCSVSSPSTGTPRSATGCCSKRAASTASSAGAACTCRPARATTSTPSRRA